MAVTTSPNIRLEDAIIQKLQSGPLPTTTLIDELRRTRGSVSKQGVYRALRKLAAEEKVVLHSKRVSLNTLWVTRMREFFTVASVRYTDQTDHNHVAHLAPGEKVVHHFSDLAALSVFADHTFHLLTLIHEGISIYVYNPHEWFAYLRPREEKLLLSMTATKKQRLYIATSHNDSLDRALHKKFRSDELQYHILPTPLTDDDGYYVCIFGDILLELLLETKAVGAIDEFFKRHKEPDTIPQADIDKLNAVRGKYRVIVSNNPGKASRIVGKLRPHFY